MSPNYSEVSPPLSENAQYIGLNSLFPSGIVSRTQRSRNRQKDIALPKLMPSISVFSGMGVAQHYDNLKFWFLAVLIDFIVFFLHFGCAALWKICLIGYLRSLPLAVPTVSSTEYDHIGLKTVSADHKSHRLYVTMDEMHQLDRNKHIIIRDLNSFVEFRVVDTNLCIRLPVPMIPGISAAA